MGQNDYGVKLSEPTIYDPPSGLYYQPFIAPDGRVGYRVGSSERGDWETFIYLNPSISEGPGDGNVFLYEGGENLPEHDSPITFVSVSPDADPEYEATQAGAKLSADDEIIDPWDAYPGGMSDGEPSDDEVMNPGVYVPDAGGYALDDPKHPDWRP